MLDTRTLKTIDVSILSALLQNANFLEGIDAGRTHFDDTYEPGEALTVDEMTELVEETGFNSKELEHSAKTCFILDAMTEQGQQWEQLSPAYVRSLSRRLDWSAFERTKETRKAESFIYCLGFVVGVIDSSLQPVEQAG